MHVSRVFQGLLSGELDSAHLSTRKLARWLGVSSGWLYHNHGSFDGFLLEVAALGARHLLDQLPDDFHEAVEAFLAFEKDHSALYELLFVRPWAHKHLMFLDYEADDAVQHIWSRFARLAAEAGSLTPSDDADALLVIMHGAIMLRRVHRGREGTPDWRDEGRSRRAVFHVLRRMGGIGGRFEGEDPWITYGAT